MTALQELETPQRRRVIAEASLRALSTVVLLVALYFLLPLDHLTSGIKVLVLAIGVVGVFMVIGVEARAIVNAQYPAIRAVEALATVGPLFLLLFATLYYLLDTSDPSNFSQHLSRMDALYFTVTTFATVGYGDITPVTEGARIAVTFQMFMDLVLIGLGIRSLAAAVTLGRERQTQS